MAARKAYWEAIRLHGGDDWTLGNRADLYEPYVDPELRLTEDQARRVASLLNEVEANSLYVRWD